MPIDPMTLSAGLSAGSSLLGGLFGSDAAEEAADAQRQAAELATAEQRRQYEQTRKDLTPWRKTGNQAIQQLGFLLGLGNPSSYNPALAPAQRAVADAEREYNALLQASQAPTSGGWQNVYEEGGLNTGDREFVEHPRDGMAAPVDSNALDAARSRLEQARNALTQVKNSPYDPGSEYGSLMRNFSLEDFETDPGYQFRLDQGNQSIENSAAAKGMQLSGATLKGLNRFNQDFASNEFGNAYNRDAANKSRKFNFLTGTSGQGLNAAGMTANYGQQGANNIADLYTQSGNAQAAGIIGGANALQSGLTGAGNSLQDYTMMKTLMRTPGTSNFQYGTKGY